jgi:hypothetical protein
MAKPCALQQLAASCVLLWGSAVEAQLLGNCQERRIQHIVCCMPLKQGTTHSAPCAGLIQPTPPNHSTGIRSVLMEEGATGDNDKRHLTPNHPHIVIMLTNIANVHKHSEDYSLFVYRHVYLMQVRAFGSVSIEVAGTLSSIGGLMQYHLKDYESAFDSYQEALQVR